METSPSPGSSSSPKLSVHTEGAQDIFARILAIPHVHAVIKALQSSSQVALVGGLVRDACLGIEQTDIDLAVKIPPLEVKSRLEASGIRVVETGIIHGTVTAVIDKQHIEITTFRKPGSRASSVFSESIEEDLSGRDFTINAIAYDVEKKILIDPFGGIEDLKNNRLCAVGDAETRFKEDPHRILRMIRFGAASKRTTDTNTLAAAEQLRDLIKTVSVERIRVEFERILLSADPAEALRLMLKLGLIELIIPEMLPSVGCEQNEFHIHDVFEHTLWVIERCPADRILRLTGLFHDLGKPATLSVGDDGRRHFYLHEQVSANITKTVMERLKYSHNETESISKLVAYHMRPLTCGPQGCRRLMRDLGPLLDQWLLFKRADSTPTFTTEDFERDYNHFMNLLSDENKRVTGSVHSRLAIDGNDLIKLGLRSGPALGKILKTLEELVLEDPELNQRETLLSRAKELIPASS